MTNSNSRILKTAFAALAVTSALSIDAVADEHEKVKTQTPVEHLVVIFQENVSFDHYFATYPLASNPPGEPFFEARDGTPSVNGLGTLVKGIPQGVLLTDNPNANNHANDVGRLYGGVRPRHH